MFFVQTLTINILVDIILYMKMKKFVFFILLITIFFSFNIVCAGNFTDLSNEIDDKDSITLDDDVVLNEESSGEEEVFKSVLKLIIKILQLKEIII